MLQFYLDENNNKRQEKIISCDGVKKGIRHSVKMMSFWCKNRVMSFLLDDHATIDIKISIAEAIDSSLAKVYGIESDGNSVKEKMMGLS